MKAEKCLLSLWGRTREEGPQAILFGSFCRLPDKVEVVISVFCKQLEVSYLLSFQRLSAIQTAAGRASKLRADNAGSS